MTSSSVAHAVNVPVRSISLPSRLQLNSIETELNELKTYGVLSGVGTTQGGGETLCEGLTRLAKLYNNIEEVIQSPFTHQALHHQQNVKPVEQALDDSVGLLDACSTARDLITMMKEQVHDLQSALRRRGRDSSIGNDIHAYISFRKNVVKSLKQSNAVAISIFRSLLSFLSMPVTKTKAGAWSLISKFIPVVAGRNQEFFNEVRIVDLTLYTLRERVQKSDAKIDAGG
ncbi:putative Selection and upkeep of intraepithelial T-cells protein 6 [Hibiscus syriacus]|uniref:Selection and upkeep of intraepithelial T-cells protein 6 n=1 Tax=Hibiscus syriacus TaxID=106335 RepID=A0A6A2ZQP7_HIBSY|nr:putative Selection and upkeep of intraepithelial T-cells protein 6 [Hibiscus syriacus]